MELRIEKLVYGGDGLAHHAGQTVFVPLVLPGELVRIEPASQKRKFLRGRRAVPVFWALRRLPLPAHAL
jgi:23S rRNA (uracil1939-C5)-methyltransferase